MNILKTLGISVIPSLLLILSANTGLISLGSDNANLKHDIATISQKFEELNEKLSNLSDSRGVNTLPVYSAPTNLEDKQTLDSELVTLNQRLELATKELRSLEGVVFKLDNQMQFSSEEAPLTAYEEAPFANYEDETLTLQEKYTHEFIANEGQGNNRIYDTLLTTDLAITNPTINCSISTCKITFDHSSEDAYKLTLSLVESMRNSGINVPSYEVTYGPGGSVELFLDQT